ncbi:MAG: hypothetical protein H6636_08115 [Anaerolineales bacterium]|nr:hypothetical protein [Anaerolineales bacterium]
MDARKGLGRALMRGAFGLFKRYQGGFWRLVLCYLVGSVAVAPPGLCACWLNPNVATVHPHVSPEHAHHSHSHDYLLQLAQTLQTEVKPLKVTPTSFLIAMARAGDIWWSLPGLHVHTAEWEPLILPPPPKL